MLSVIQLVTNAHVTVDEIVIGTIQQGIVALIGIEKTDTEKEAVNLVDKMMNYRIFRDKAGKTNLSLIDVQGGLLLYSARSQFAVLSQQKLC